MIPNQWTLITLKGFDNLVLIALLFCFCMFIFVHSFKIQTLLPPSVSHLGALMAGKTIAGQ